MSKSQLVERTLPGLHQSLIQDIPGLSYETEVLDIGCGTGAWLERLAEAGFHKLYGIDINISNFESKKATCLQANLDFDDLDLGDKKFGLITAIEVLEHLESPGRLFCQVKRYLDEDGYFLITTPNIHSINCRLRFLITGKLASFDKKGDPTHIYPVLLECVDRILSRYSLKVVKTWTYPVEKSIVFRESIQWMSKILKLFLPNLYPGDTLCLLIQRT
jgi:2-polyprenyl-3-methyl-5-hydroxy-6-metoxy-1,4-benzoquinol methylase